MDGFEVVAAAGQNEERESSSLARLDDVQSDEQIALRRIHNAQEVARAALEGCKLLTVRAERYSAILRVLAEDIGRYKDITNGLFSATNKETRQLKTFIRTVISTKETLEKHLATKKTRDTAELTLSAAALDKFFKAAHDINNMLAVVMGYLELAAQGIKVPQYIGFANAALLRIEAVLLEVTAEPECKRQNLVEALHILESEKAGLEVSFEADIPEAEHGAEVDMSPNDLGRLIFDLLDNAKKAGATEARVRALLLDGKLAICVKDNGPGFNGLDPLEASRLSRAAGAEHGNGIGICEEICFKAGGILVLMDKDDTTGAEFLISLPIRAAVRH